MSYYVIKYEFMGQDSAGLRGADRKIQVIKFFEPLGTSRRGIPWEFRGSPMATPVEKFRNRPFPGTKLDVPRLAAPRGPARGAAREPAGPVVPYVCVP